MRILYDAEENKQLIKGEKADSEKIFSERGPLRLTFFSCHLDSTNGTTVEAFDFNKRKLIRLSPNYATPIAHGKSLRQNSRQF